MSEAPIHMMFGYPTKEEFEAGKLTEEHEESANDYYKYLDDFRKNLMTRED